jgi:hypothetical protein
MNAEIEQRKLQLPEHLHARLEIAGRDHFVEQ